MVESLEDMQLPEHWVTITLGELVAGRGKSFNPTAYADAIFELYSVPSFDEKHPEIVSGYEIGSNKQYVEEGMVLLCKINPRINRVWVVGSFSEYEKIASTEWILFPQVSGIIPKYLAYYMSQDTFAAFLSLNASGVGGSLMRVKPRTIENYPFPLAPLNEQDRIVDEIDTQFSRLDSWLEVMHRLREELPRLRASILKAAVEGRLVPQYPDDEPAEILLQRILDERRRKWEADYLADLEAKGKPAPKDAKWKEKYQDPFPPDTDGLPELPQGWIWASLGELIYTIEAGKSIQATNQPAEEGQYGVLKVSAISWGHFRPEENKALKSNYSPNPTHLVRKGDFIISRANTVELVGAVVLVGEEHENLLLSDKTLRLVPVSQEVYKDYLLYTMRSHFVRDYYEPLATGTSDSMRNLSQNKILGAPIALPPLQEQERIIEDLEMRFSVIHRLEEVIKVNIKRAERMRQAVLKKAFEGRLVEQDPDDEPASELLERIHEERKRRTEEVKQQPKQPRERKMSTQRERQSLYDTLLAAGKPLSPHELFQRAGFTHETIDDFYEELRVAVDQLGTIQSWLDEEYDEVYLGVTG